MCDYMENETKKSNKGLITLVIILVLVIIVLAGYMIYDKLIGKTNEPINNNTNTAQNTSTPSTPVDLSEKDYEELTRDAKVDFEDEKYISYELDDDSMCGDKIYIVYDKTDNTYYNEWWLDSSEQITYFGKIDGDYYYFIRYWIGTPARGAYTKILKNGSLFKEIKGDYAGYDSETKKFNFAPCPQAAMDSSDRTWSPTQD